MTIEDTHRDLIGESSGNQRGVALLTVMIIALIMTILGIAAITVTGLETRMSGFVRTKEVVSAAAESCEGTAVNIIQQTLYYGMIQPAFLDNATPPGPIPAANSATVFSEISGQPLPSPPAAPNTIAENYNDSPTSAPNLQLTNIPGFTVQGDIDRMYKHLKEGQGDLKEIVYRITCVATNVATGSANTVTSVYKCTVGDTCMKQIGS
ncbi:MAG TPA: PilX N-terminal domain-containing pilus assembly protein [Nitrospira sp.]|nr:PilX N-terminal domain-containing pilus assembly protein [Nitrospira sp.]